jgi:hypothetical protein
MHTMVTWEYLLIDSRHYKHDDLQRLLNKLGMEGWEMAGCGNLSGSTHRLYLKRPRS